MIIINQFIFIIIITLFNILVYSKTIINIFN
uniref:Uncharacterized protein n=1 Tax=viral metagenome TaxID=1070528 RepID=A0A6C0H7C5_9ZZZZ